MVFLCKALEPQTPEHSWCLIIAQFPQAWEGKAEACCTIKVIIQEQKLPAILQHSSCWFPPSCIPRTAERLKVRFKQVWSSAGLQSQQVVLGGRDFPPVPEGWVGAARPRWSFVVILKQTGFPSALCLLLASPWSCSLLCCGVLWGCCRFGVPCGGQSSGREVFAIPTWFQMSLEVLAGDPKCS